MTEHIVRAYDKELDELGRHIAEMGGIAEKMVIDAMDALGGVDLVLAQQVSLVLQIRRGCVWGWRIDGAHQRRRDLHLLRMGNLCQCGSGRNYKKNQAGLRAGHIHPQDDQFQRAYSATFLGGRRGNLGPWAALITGIGFLAKIVCATLKER